ncbi:manganese efflux pump MntP family protein [Thermicanus aegyptius]|uniref:manganese efflux pump MntP n=1 Tax=Thermicanus aegyptius TaxID=94009 RepID=UPI000412BB89|nr:manganese efflux pump [Thermicanus aegyptius]
MEILLGKLVTINMLALAVGMDAFSLGVGIGMTGVKVRQFLRIGFLIGLLHVLMPLIGMGIGNLLSRVIGGVAHAAGGAVLIFIGAQMFFSSWLKTESRLPLLPAGWLGTFLLALGVSLDALSIGLSLGLFSVHSWVMLGFFGLWGGLLPLGGIFLGRQMVRNNSWMGEYGERMGGIIMILLGIKLMF